VTQDGLQRTKTAPGQHADEAERFAKALASDTILPEDF